MCVLHLSQFGNHFLSSFARRSWQSFPLEDLGQRLGKLFTPVEWDQLKSSPAFQTALDRIHDDDTEDEALRLALDNPRAFESTPLI